MNGRIVSRVIAVGLALLLLACSQYSAKISHVRGDLYSGRPDAALARLEEIYKDDSGLPYLMAEVAYAVQHEMALTLADVLIRRTHVIYEVRDGSLARAPAVADLMAERLGWDEAERDRELADYARQVALTQGWREE